MGRVPSRVFLSNSTYFDSVPRQSLVCLTDSWSNIPPRRFLPQSLCDFANSRLSEVICLAVRGFSRSYAIPCTSVMRPFEETHCGSDQPRTPDLAAMYRSCSYKDVRRLGFCVSSRRHLTFRRALLSIPWEMSSSSLRSSEKASGSVSYYKIPPFNVFETIYEEEPMMDSNPPSADLAPVQDDDGSDIVSLLILDEGDHPDQGQSTRRRSGSKGKPPFNSIIGFMRNGLSKRQSGPDS